MRKAILSAIVLSFAASAAYAEGLSPPLSIGYVANRPVTCHLRALGQGSFINHDVTMGESVSIDSLGSVGTGVGLQGGCSYVVNQFLLGVDVDYTWDASRFSAKVGSTTLMELPFGNQASATGRLGYVTPGKNVIYVLGGITWAQGRTGSMMGTPLAFDGPQGTTLGGGIEIPLSGPFVANLEYRHVDFGRDADKGVSAGTTENIVRAGIGVKF